MFLGIFIGPMCTWDPIYGSWCQSLTDTNSILTDDTNRTVPGNMAMHVATWLPNLKLVQVAPAGGQI